MVASERPGRPSVRFARAPAFALRLNTLSPASLSSRQSPALHTARCFGCLSVGDRNAPALTKLELRLSRGLPAFVWSSFSLTAISICRVSHSWTDCLFGASLREQSLSCSSRRFIIHSPSICSVCVVSPLRLTRYVPLSMGGGTSRLPTSHLLKTHMTWHNLTHKWFEKTTSL